MTINAQNRERTKARRLWLWFCLLILAIVIAWWFLGHLINWEAFHALADALAFGCLLVTLFQQRGEIRHLEEATQLQRSELRILEETTQLQRSELRHLEQATQLQGFQNNFFNFLSLFNQFVSSLSEGNREGRECTAEWKRRLEKDLEPCQHADDKNKCFDDFLKARKNHMRPYYQYLQNVLEIIHNEVQGGNGNPYLDPKRYIDIVKAQLSPDEEHLLNEFCYSRDGRRMKQLVEELNLISLQGDYWQVSGQRSG